MGHYTGDRFSTITNSWNNSICFSLLKSHHKVADVMIKLDLTKLTRLYGQEAGQPVSVYYQDWAREEFTTTEYDQRSALNYPEYQPSAGKISIWDGSFYFAVTETADHLSVYLEGALSSAERAVATAI
jgi:monoamine oxidase